MAETPPDYPATIDYSVPLETWTFTSHRTGHFNLVVLLPSRRRRNCFAIEVNGKMRQPCMGYDRAMRWIVKGLSR